MMEFSPSHHAVLFALIARQMMAWAGPAEGERVVRLGVRRYGEQRGRRMAQRALAAGEPLNVQSYFKYGEWQAGPGEVEQSTPDTQPHTRSLFTRCPWNQSWRDQDLLAYGRLYCLEIDPALARGFNPALTLEVNGTLSAGRDRCEFIFKDSVLDTALLGVKPAVRPWDYHLGHLYQTLRSVASEAWGAPGLAAAAAALDEFGRRYGPAAKAAVLAHLETNFDLV